MPVRPLLVLLAVLILPPVLLLAQNNGNGAASEISIILNSHNLPIGREEKNITAFYAARSYASAWQMENTRGTNAVREFVQYIEGVLHEHGLNKENYPLQLFETKASQGSYAEADILATFLVLKIARSLSGGDPVPQDDPEHVWPLRRSAPNLPQGMNDAVQRYGVPQWLDGLAPQYPQYKRLKDALTQYRAIAAKGGWIKLVPGYRLNMGQTSPQVPLLAQRLWQEGYLPQAAVQYANSLYTPQIAQAVMAFQEAHGLITDGNIGPQTLLALNIGVVERIDSIRANLARMRITPREAWDGIMINVPSYSLTLYKDSEEVYQAPVVVGRPDRASPLVTSSINDIVINPPWYVPSSIAEKDIIPQLQENPQLLEEMNMVGPSDAQSAADGQFMQKPGPENSLGRIKFNFPNRFAVYLHGTPHVELFDRDDRRQSSGCVRLKKPEELMEILMGNSSDWTEARIQDRIDSMKTMHITPKVKMPIRMLYWTVMVNSKGRIGFYNDVYQLDDPWLAIQ
jgi:L,D-transpeptidase YcbB